MKAYCDKILIRILNFFLLTFAFRELNPTISRCLQSYFSFILTVLVYKAGHWLLIPYALHSNHYIHLSRQKSEKMCTADKKLPRRTDVKSNLFLLKNPATCFGTVLMPSSGHKLEIKIWPDEDTSTQQFDFTPILHEVCHLLTFLSWQWFLGWCTVHQPVSGGSHSWLLYITHVLTPGLCLCLHNLRRLAHCHLFFY